MVDQILSYRVVSILASAKLADRLPITDMLALEPFNRTAEYADVPRLAFRIGPKRRHVTIFQNGTATVRGCDSFEEAGKLLAEARELVRGVVCLPPAPVRPVVQNIVATHDLRRPIELPRVVQRLPSEDVSYEPEQFPGLILRFPNDKAVVLIFSSGKVVITGTRSISHLEQLLSKVHRLLAEAHL